MLLEGAMIFTWLGAGATVGSLLTYRICSGVVGQEKEAKVKAYEVENEALGRTNLIYRERIEQLESALFSNEKFMEMAREIDFLRASNFKLRSRLRDLEALVQAEKKRGSREQVERLESTVRELRLSIEKKAQQVETLPAIQVLSAQREVAAAKEMDVEVEVESQPERPVKQRQWSPVIKVRRIT